ESYSEPYAPLLPITAQRESVIRHDCAGQRREANTRIHNASASVHHRNLHTGYGKGVQPVRIARLHRWSDLDTAESRIWLAGGAIYRVVGNLSRVGSIPA